MADLCVVFKEASILLSTNSCFPPTVVFHQQRMRVPFSPASLPTFVVGGVFDDSYSNRSEMES
jgi:hypothetical protein